MQMEDFATQLYLNLDSTISELSCHVINVSYPSSKIDCIAVSLLSLVLTSQDIS